MSQWIVNSQFKLACFLKHLHEEYEQHKYLRIELRAGAERSLSQNALWALWAREQIAPFLGITEEQTRMLMYHMFLGYHDETIKGPKGDLVIDHQLRTTTRPHRLTKGEMHDFLTRVEMWCSERGLYLEVKGEYDQLKKEQVA